MSATTVEPRPSGGARRPQRSDAQLIARRQRSERGVGRLIVSILPAIVLYLVGFISPLYFLGYAASEKYSPLLGAHSPGSLSTITSALTSESTSSSLVQTIILALVVVAISVVLGYLVALAFRFGSVWLRTLILLTVTVPLLINSVVRTFGWILLIGPGGVLTNILGVQLMGKPGGVVLVLVNLFVSYMVLSLIPALGRVKQEELDAANVLGESRIRTLFRVILPLSLPGLLSGSVIIFGASSGAVVAPYLIGGSTFNVVSVKIYQQALIFTNTPMAAALAILLLIVTVVLVVVLEKVVRRVWLRWDA